VAPVRIPEGKEYGPVPPLGPELSGRGSGLESGGRGASGWFGAGMSQCREMAPAGRRSQPNAMRRGRTLAPTARQHCWMRDAPRPLRRLRFSSSMSMGGLGIGLERASFPEGSVAGRAGGFRRPPALSAVAALTKRRQPCSHHPLPSAS
jgi:hypothetical protein